ncbi:MAG: hypothetical protein ABL901_14070 [Hyphomicrobiaceae bacterium]
MEAKDAVYVAKAYFEELFSEKGTLEEIWFDEREGGMWYVTLGLKREMQPQVSVFNTGKPAYPRIDTTYKVVRVRDKDGKALSVKNRDGERAA